MQPGLQLHRSIIFWSGLLVMGFIVWAWWDSMQFTTRAWHEPHMLTQAGSGISVDNTGGPGLGKPFGGDRYPITLDFPVHFENFPAPRFIRDTGFPIEEWDEVTTRAFTDESAVFTMEEYMKIMVGSNSPSGMWMIFIPHWLLLLGTALLWAGLLGWRVWRRKVSATRT